jgi:hypothetical protein
MSNSLGFFSNCGSFIIIEVPIIFLLVILMKIIFNALRNYSISQIFRKFDFWFYFALIIFEGNVQQFSFYMTSELIVTFAFEWVNKFIKTFIIFFGFCLFLFSVCGYLIGLSFYSKLNRYFTDNNKNILRGNLLLLLQNSMRNLILGVVHSFFRNGNYMVLISILLSV